jgi:small subunit ribosomal protein S5e
MMKGRNNGKKLLAVRIVAHAFEIIHLLTDQNPIQVGATFHYDSTDLTMS